MLTADRLAEIREQLDRPGRTPADLAAWAERYGSVLMGCAAVLSYIASGELSATEASARAIEALRSLERIP